VQGVKDSGVLGTDHPRPMGLVFDHSKHIRVENITVQNAGFWQIVPYYSDDLKFRNMRILAPTRPTPTPSIPSARRTSSSTTSSPRSATTTSPSSPAPSTRPAPTIPSHDITITDCTFENGHGLSIGSEIAGGVQNVHAERIHFKGTDQGIRIKANRDRGNDVSNITFKDIDMVDVKTAILISEYYPKVYPEGDVAAAPIGRSRRSSTASPSKTSTPRAADVAGVIVGLPESPVKDLVLKNVDIQARTGMKIAYAQVVFDNVKVVAAEGQAIQVSPTATVTGK
jgi:hypothetical protein